MDKEQTYPNMIYLKYILCVKFLTGSEVCQCMYIIKSNPVVKLLLQVWVFNKGYAEVVRFSKVERDEVDAKNRKNVALLTLFLCQDISSDRQRSIFGLERKGGRQRLYLEITRGCQEYVYSIYRIVYMLKSAFFHVTFNMWNIRYINMTKCWLMF